MTISDLLSWIEEHGMINVTPRQILQAGLEALDKEERLSREKAADFGPKCDCGGAKLNTTHSDWCSSKATP